MESAQAGRFYARQNSLQQLVESSLHDQYDSYGSDGPDDSDIAARMRLPLSPNDADDESTSDDYGMRDDHQRHLGTSQARLVAERVLGVDRSLPGTQPQPLGSPIQMQPERFDVAPQRPRPDTNEPTVVQPEQLPKRNASVVEKSPLQKLEVRLSEISKEEKRAKIIQAEQRAMQRSSMQSEPAMSPSPRPLSQTVHRKPLPQPDPVTDKPEAARKAEDKYRNVSGGGRGREALAEVPFTSPDRAARKPVRIEYTERSQLTRTSSSRTRDIGYDAARTGGAAAAAIEAYQAVRRGRYSQGGSPSVANGEQRGKPEWSRRTSVTQVRNTSTEMPPSANTQLPSRDSSSRHFANPHEKESQESTQNLARTYQQNHEHKERRTLGERIGDRIKPKSEDIVPPEAVQRRGEVGAHYEQPPQTLAGARAREAVGFGNTDPNEQAVEAHETRHEGHHRIHFADLIGGHDHSDRRYEASRSLDEWRTARVATLLADDGYHNTSNDQAGARVSVRNGTSDYNTAFGRHGGTGNSAQTTFEPPLVLTCGPLLRYMGVGTETGSSRAFWRGSVMIVTQDLASKYQPAPVLRIFEQPMNMIPPPPQEVNGAAGQELSSEYVDPLAGQIKVSRTGRALYVRPVHHLQREIDLSRLESNDGLFETNPSMEEQNASARIHSEDGEARNNFTEVAGFRLHAEHGVTFWRFNLRVQLAPEQRRIAYRINRGPAIAFWIPARDQAMMNVMFHSCNGFSMNILCDDFSGPDPMWRDVLNTHQTTPIHCMIGGGDQIYNDAAMKETDLFQEWLSTENPLHKHSAPFSAEMQEELERFYLQRYSMWFSQGLFGMAASQIPMVNMWDDHDIIDGFGSYPHHFQGTPVFAGVGAVAFKYYMLFQHQSLPDEDERSEPSWLLGASPGPYINQLSRSVFMPLGKQVILLGLDCRTERMKDEVLSQETYDIIFDRCRREIVRGETKHLVVLLGVPIAYPRLNWLENIFTSKAMEPVKALGRAGLLGNFVNKFDGGVELLDDLDDHWTAKHHKQERNWFIQELQELAAEKSVRVTILSGDVHLAAVGQFFSNPKLNMPKDRDHRYMPNVISSAIVNAPPPEMMADVLNKRNRIHHLDQDTDEDMIPLFPFDVDGQKRRNTHLMPRRNWCSLKGYITGYTPPPSPPPQEPPVPRRSFSLTRSSSLTRQDPKRGNLLARVSSTRRVPPSSYRPDSTNPYGTNELDPRVNGPQRNRDSSMDSTQADSGYADVASDGRGRPDLSRSGSYRRRPTSLSRKSSRKDRTGREGYIDLEGGLEITINCEVDPKDPAGVTTPYRLLVPALFSGDTIDPNQEEFKERSGLSGLLGSLRRHRSSSRKPDTDHRYIGDYGQPSYIPQNDHHARLDGEAENFNYNENNRPLTGDSSMNPHRANTTRTYSQTSNDDHDRRLTTNTASHQRASLDSERHQPPESALQRLPRSSAPFDNDAFASEAFARRPTSRGRQQPQIAQGPPPPSNIDQLPISVQKRYSQLENSGGSTQRQRSSSSHRQSHNAPSQDMSVSYNNTVRPPWQENSLPATRDRHYYAGAMEAPLLPVGEKQLRTSDKRTNYDPLLVVQAPAQLQPQQQYQYGNERRVVSGPPAFQDSMHNNRDSTFGGGPLHSQSNRQSLPLSSNPLNQQPMHNNDNTMARSNTYHGPSAAANRIERNPYATYDDSDPESPDRHVSKIPQRRPSKFERHYGGFATASEAQQDPNRGQLFEEMRDQEREHLRNQSRNVQPAQGTGPVQSTTVLVSNENSVRTIPILNFAGGPPIVPTNPQNQKQSEDEYHNSLRGYSQNAMTSGNRNGMVFADPQRHESDLYSQTDDGESAHQEQQQQQQQRISARSVSGGMPSKVAKHFGGYDDDARREEWRREEALAMGRGHDGEDEGGEMGKPQGWEDDEGVSGGARDGRSGGAGGGAGGGSKRLSGFIRRLSGRG